MVAVVFLTRLAAHLFGDAVDAEYSYPRAGVRVGGGIHVGLILGRTARYGAVMKHPVLARWSYPDDPAVVEKRPRIPLPGGAVSQALDATWDHADED